MKRLYETKISDKRWYLYDLPGNVGWIAYIVCLILGFVKLGEYTALNIIGIVPAVFMLIGIGELISERIAKLDRILPFARLLRGFGALTFGGLLGCVVGLVAVCWHFNAVYLIMTLGGALCLVCGGLLLIGYKNKNEESVFMKPDYKNWVPKGMVIGFWLGAAAAWIVTAIFGAVGFANALTWAIVLFAVLAIVAVVLCVVAVFMQMWHNAFSYNGKRKLSKDIIEGTASFVNIPVGGTCLDVGCGSGALTIAVAKRNPNATIVGVDRWGKDYASFSRELCKNNAVAEGVKNIAFQKGDATALDFPNESFDAVTSNYVYHNIPSNDRQAILLETLRVLKKGGTFAIHDLFTKQKYGDMQAFMKKLKEMGYEKVELIDTTKGKFMSEKEAKYLFLSGSAILYGKK